MNSKEQENIITDIENKLTQLKKSGQTIQNLTNDAVLFLLDSKKSIDKLVGLGFSTVESKNYYSNLVEVILDKIKTDTGMHLSEIIALFQANRMTEMQVKEFLFEIVSNASAFAHVFEKSDLITEKTRFRITQFSQEISNLSKPYQVETKKGACYIATMAYGYYDHPQVIILREFRDEVLNNSIMGRWFIKFYYYFSPKLVVKLKDNKSINSIIRISLNRFIKLIR